jgi:hypothetical protein
MNGPIRGVLILIAAPAAAAWLASVPVADVVSVGLLAWAAFVVTAKVPAGTLASSAAKLSVLLSCILAPWVALVWWMP